MGWVGRRVEPEKESSLSNTLLTHCYFSHTFYFYVCMMHVCIYDVCSVCKCPQVCTTGQMWKSEDNFNGGSHFLRCLTQGLSVHQAS